MEATMAQRRGRPTAQVVLSEEEREVLERWARRPKSAQALALRCRIVLAAAGGATNQEIAAELGCHPTTVGKWRNRFAELGVDGLHDEPRPGKPRTISDDDVERVIVKTLEETPHPMPPTGRPARWPRRPGCPRPRFGASGERSG
jgi:DNA-binding CsgD family transcriptional regulator